MPRLFVSIIAMLALVSLASAQMPTWTDQVERAPGADVATVSAGQSEGSAYKALTNWSKGYMEFEASTTCDLRDATNDGQAEHLASEGAKVLAYRKAVEFINGVLVSDAFTGMQKGVVKEELITAKAAGLVRNAVIISDTVFWKVGQSGSRYPWATVKLGVLLYSDRPTSTLLSAIFDDLLAGYKDAGYQNYQLTETQPKTAPASPYTGLLIDARGQKLNPSLLPLVLVLGLEKKVVYSGTTVSRDFALKNGLAGFAKAIESAKQNDRLIRQGVTNPLLVKAASVADNVLYLTPDDAARVAAANVTGNFLEECRVVILLD